MTAPAFTFTGDNNTGIYRPGADSLSITLGGAEKVKFETNAVTFGGQSTYYPRIRIGSTSGATTPSYTWWGNDQTGMYRPDNNIIGFSTNGNERMTISDAGVNLLDSDITTVSLNFVASGSGSFVATTGVLSASATTYFWIGGNYTYLYLDVESAPGSNVFNPTFRVNGVVNAHGDVLVPAGCKVKVFISQSGGLSGYFRKFGL